MKRRSLGIGATAIALVIGLSGCAGGGQSAPTPTATDSPTATDASGSTGATGSITVFAAASLTETFTELGTRFEASHEGTTVAFSFNGSSTLVQQIDQGAPADVFASADTANMDKLTASASVTATPKVFATNTLEIAVPNGNPAEVRNFADLAKSGVKTVVCAPQVPCGAATATIEQKTGVTLAPVSEELSVTDVLAKVESGEADAGVVYVTDVTGAHGKVDGVTFSQSSEAVNSYPIAPVAAAANPALAKEFIAYVTGSAGRKVLTQAGFGAP